MSIILSIIIFISVSFQVQSSGSDLTTEAFHNTTSKERKTYKELMEIFYKECLLPGKTRNLAIARAQKNRGRIVNNLDKFWVLESINEFEQDLAKCKIPNNLVGAAPQDFANWRKSARLHQKQLYMNSLKEKASRSVIDPITLSYSVTDMKFLGIYNQQIQNEINALIKQGQINTAQQKMACGGSNEKNLSKNFGPSRDQGLLGWCFAFATADQLSYETKQAISAADIALSHFEKETSLASRLWTQKKSVDYEGGWPPEASENALNKGLCLESKFRSNDNGLGSYRKTLDQIQDINKHLRISPACNSEEKLVQRIFPNLKLAEVTNAIFTSTKVSFINRLATMSCEPRIFPKNLNATVLYGNAPTDSKKILSILNQGLEKNKPIAISFNGRALNSSIEFSSSPNHAVLVIGRRFDATTGQCQYLIRNSWGKDCNQYDPMYSCDQKGHVWVPQYIIERSIAHASYYN